MKMTSSLEGVLARLRHRPALAGRAILLIPARDVNDTGDSTRIPGQHDDTGHAPGGGFGPLLHGSSSVRKESGIGIGTLLCCRNPLDAAILQSLAS